MFFDCIRKNVPFPLIDNPALAELPASGRLAGMASNLSMSVAMLARRKKLLLSYPLRFLVLLVVLVEDLSRKPYLLFRMIFHTVSLTNTCWSSNRPMVIIATF